MGAVDELTSLASLCRQNGRQAPGLTRDEERQKRRAQWITGKQHSTCPRVTKPRSPGNRLPRDPGERAIMLTGPTTAGGPLSSVFRPVEISCLKVSNWT